MSCAFYVSFELDDDSDYARRYQRLHDVISACAMGNWWNQTTSYIVFRSEVKADAIATAIEAELGPMDLAIIGSPEIKVLLVIGENPDPDIFDLVPFARGF